MKVLVVIAALLFVSWRVDARAIEHTEGINEAGEACVTELNLDRNKIFFDNTDQPFPENNVDFTNYMRCTGKKWGHITSNGHINYQVIKDGMLDDLKNDPEMTPAMFPRYILLAKVTFRNCQQNPPTETDPGLAYIKAMNCITTGMNGENR